MSMEEEVAEPTDHDFIQKYRLPTASSIFKSIKALQEKKLIYMTGTQPDTDKHVYQIYDVFLGRWMQYR